MLLATLRQCRLVLAGLVTMVPAAAAAQAVVTGRVVGANGAPVAAAVVELTALPEGPRASTLTRADGSYRIVAPAVSGTFRLRVERLGFFPLSVGLRLEPGQASATRDIRLNPSAVELPGLDVSARRTEAAPLVARSPGGSEDTFQPFTTDQVPLRPGDLGDLAGLQAKVLWLGGGEGDYPNVSIAGQPPSQNGVTLDGASFGAATVPQEALRSATVATSTYDVSRGQFSGGQIAATTRAGSNLFGAGLSLRLGPPLLRSGGAAAAPGFQARTDAGLGFGGGGAVVRDRLFWYAALQASRRESPIRRLNGLSPLTLQALGVSPDSAERFNHIIGEIGSGPIGRAADVERWDAASMMLRFDYRITANYALLLRLDGRENAVAGFGEDPLAAAGGGGTLDARSGGVLAQLTSHAGSLQHRLRVYRTGSARGSEPFSREPSAVISVDSELDGGEAGSAFFRFGGSPLLGARSGGALLEVADELRLGNGDRRFRAGLLFSREDAYVEGSANANGTFSFGSLGDLQAGRPQSFRRTLAAPRHAAAVEHLAVHLGGERRARRGLSLTYGVRLEGRWYPSSAAPAAVDPGLAQGAGRIGADWGVSPRLGFVYEGRKWTFRGGSGEFRGRIPAGALPGALAEIGEAGANAELVCLGPATPLPEWSAYRLSPASIPEMCAGGAPGFSSHTPRTTVFEDGFSAPRTWHSSLGLGRGQIATFLGQAGVRAEVDWVRGFAQTVAFDGNLRPDPAFRLAGEDGRPVYVPAASIDPASAGISPTAGWTVPALGSVRRVSDHGRSGTLQLSAGAHALTRTLTLWAVDYTYTRSWDEVGPLAAPVGGGVPLAPVGTARLTRGVSDLERRQLVQLQLTRPFNRRRLEVGAVGRIMSGAAYTPRVDRDIDGDGAANDRAFVPDPAGLADSAAAATLVRLLDTGSGSTRACLRRNLSRLAARNSCRTPWFAALDLRANLWPGQTFDSRRVVLSITASNVLDGLDRLAHGARALRGWGQPQVPDATLLRVESFDAAAARYRYAVNPDFGVLRPGRNPLYEPFALVVQARWTLGTDPVRQPLQALVRSIGAQGRSAARLRQALAAAIPNVPLQVVALDDTLELGLTAAQRSALTALGDTAGRRLAVLVDSLAAAASAAETSDGDTRRAAAARRTALVAETTTLLEGTAAAVRRVLSDEQWNRLPPLVRQPSRQLLPAHEIVLPADEP